MNTTTPQLTPPRVNPQPRIRSPRRRGPLRRTARRGGELFDERAPIIAAPAFFGPPVIFVLGPWLLLVFLLIGPLALILTLVLALALTGVLLAVVAAVIASPYLLIRHLHAHGTVRVKPRAPVPLFPKHRVSSGRLGSPQPKGVS